MSRNYLIILVVFFAVLGFYIYEKVKGKYQKLLTSSVIKCDFVVPKPEVLKDKWWGSGQRGEENRTIVTGKLEIDNQVFFYYFK